MKSKETRHLLYYVPHLLMPMAPASLLAVLSLSRLRWRRAVEPILAIAGWWLIASLTLLSLIPSKRADRLLPARKDPLLTAAALSDAMLGVTAVYQYRALVVGDTRQLRVGKILARPEGLEPPTLRSEV